MKPCTHFTSKERICLYLLLKIHKDEVILSVIWKEDEYDNK